MEIQQLHTEALVPNLNISQAINFDNETKDKK